MIGGSPHVRPLTRGLIVDVGKGRDHRVGLRRLEKDLETEGIGRLKHRNSYESALRDLLLRSTGKDVPQRAL